MALVPYLEKLCECIRNSESVAPHNKCNVLRCDNLKNHSSFIQYNLLKTRLGDCYTMEKDASNVVIKYDDIARDYNEMTPDKDEQLREIHNRAQNIIKDMARILRNLVAQNPDIHQAKLARISGYLSSKIASEDVFDINNYGCAALLGMMCEQGMLSSYRTTRNRCFNVGDVAEYQPFAYESRFAFNASRNEAQFADLLMSRGFAFCQQKTYSGCCAERMLPFDFLVQTDTYDEFLVEIQGEQHYQYIPYFHGETRDGYLRQQTHDKIKAKFAKDEDIPLLIIAHYANFAQELDNFLLEQFDI